MTSVLAAFALAQEPSETLRASVERAKRELGMKVRVDARIDIPGSDPLTIHVTAVAAREGALYIEYRASGGNVKFIVRRGDTVLEWHPNAEEWVDAKELGDSGAGRGLQNPYEALDFLLANADRAREEAPRGPYRVLSMQLGGENIRAILRPQIDDPAVRWSDSRAETALELNAQSLLPRRIDSTATLGWKEGKKIEYRGTVAVDSWEVTSMRFTEKSRQGEREIPLGPEEKKKLGLK